MNVYRYLVATTLVACCGKSQPPAAPRELTLSRCLGLGPKWDPQGQSPELVGFGVFSPVGEGALDNAFRRFGRIDRFDPTQIKLQDGTRVENFSISENHELGGFVTRNGVQQPITADEWLHARFLARLACPNPQLHGQVLPLWVEIDKAKNVTIPASETFVSSAAATVHGYVFRTAGLVTDLCADKGDVAIPFPGHWENDLNYNRSSPFFSFMCVKRDLAKCVLLGKYSLKAPATGQPDWVSACAHAMIADYCGDGQSFTKEGTQIRIWDTGIHTDPGSEDPNLEFEAAWDEHGMVCHAKTRWDVSEWAAHRRFAPCVVKQPPDGKRPLNDEPPPDAKPRCTSAGDAMEQFKGRPLLFTKSVKTNATK